jgi:hypothetical protein
MAVEVAVAGLRYIPSSCSRVKSLSPVAAAQVHNLFHAMRMIPIWKITCADHVSTDFAYYPRAHFSGNVPISGQSGTAYLTDTVTGGTTLTMSNNEDSGRRHLSIHHRYLIAGYVSTFDSPADIVALATVSHIVVARGAVWLVNRDWTFLEGQLSSPTASGGAIYSENCTITLSGSVLDIPVGFECRGCTVQAQDANLTLSRGESNFLLGGRLTTANLTAGSGCTLKRGPGGVIDVRDVTVSGGTLDLGGGVRDCFKRVLLDGLFSDAEGLISSEPANALHRVKLIPSDGSDNFVFDFRAASHLVGTLPCSLYSTVAGTQLL